MFAILIKVTFSEQGCVFMLGILGKLVGSGGELPDTKLSNKKKKLYKDLRTEFYTQLIRRNVFLQPYHHGYICYRHTDEDLIRATDMIAESLEIVRKKYLV